MDALEFHRDTVRMLKEQLREIQEARMQYNQGPANNRANDWPTDRGIAALFPINIPRAFTPATPTLLAQTTLLALAIYILPNPILALLYSLIGILSVGLISRLLHRLPQRHELQTERHRLHRLINKLVVVYRLGHARRGYGGGEVVARMVVRIDAIEHDLALERMQRDVAGMVDMVARDTTRFLRWEGVVFGCIWQGRIAKDWEDE
ncbi:hypothetical protein QBC33DRAFT_519991 [Phialemonium atrogriseum]|uniref:Uncharacterized protein n=1 Tax=Phialemonium atrogriseum TaxID=1093897 RepID=A0AAJ0BP73_9PEZI|nr:uncharacterized protein QBC33DRAFT_519991 [Phialemonium atrogriseum]KAK1761930.1 hypothetical protein QBC33DRAFT_519991 [Phialemonium atrogriseum]